MQIFSVQQSGLAEMWRKAVIGLSIISFIGLGILTWYQHDYCSRLLNLEQETENRGDKTKQAQNQATQEHLISGGPRSIFNTTPPLIHQEYSQQFQKYPKRNWSEAFICEAKVTDVALVWFTFFLVAFTGLLYWVGRNQEQATKTIERAYVKMSHTEPGIKWFEDDGWFELEMKIENFGNTPADITDVLLRPIILDDGQSLPPTPIYQRQRIVKSFHTFLVKNDFFFYWNPEMLSVGSAEIRAHIERQHKILYVFGYVDYIDKFGKSHRAGYARKYDPRPKIQNNLIFVTQAGYNYDRPRNDGE